MNYLYPLIDFFLLTAWNIFPVEDISRFPQKEVLSVFIPAQTSFLSTLYIYAIRLHYYGSSILK